MGATQENTIANLYKPETLERIYIDRCFKNDTDRVAFPKGNRLENASSHLSR